MSKHTDLEFRQQLTFQIRRALFSLSPRKKWGQRVKKAAGVLRSFSFSFDPMGGFTAGFDVEALEGHGDSGSLEVDLGDLVVAVGEAAREHHKGLLVLLDEIQFLSRAQLEAFVMALHKCVQRNLPVTVVGGGLPQIAELAGEAKSYSERLFTFPVIGGLDEADAASALTSPATNAGVTFEPEAVALAQELTSGYPFFIQELGYAAWPSGPTRSTLVEKGPLYTPSHGYAAFTVPHFDRYMLRAVPDLVVPPLRPRRLKKS